MVRALKDYGAGVGMASTIMLGAGYAGLLIEGGLGMEMGALGSETMIGGAEVLGTTSDVMDVGTEFVENGWREGLKKSGEKISFRMLEHYAKKQIKKMDVSSYEKKILETNISVKKDIIENAYENKKNTNTNEKTKK